MSGSSRGLTGHLSSECVTRGELTALEAAALGGSSAAAWVALPHSAGRCRPFFQRSGGVSLHAPLTARAVRPVAVAISRQINSFWLLKKRTDLEQEEEWGCRG